MGDNTYDGYLIFHNDHLLVRDGEIPRIPVRSPDSLGIQVNCRYEYTVGSGTRWSTSAVVDRADAPDGYAWVHLRSLFGVAEDELFWAAGHGYQLVEWDRTTRFCGVCGSPTQRTTGEIVSVCSNCGYEQYPRVSPAIICAVVRDDRILLAQNVRYRGGRYSVLAGFVESGETLEECVRREVMEESGIDVTDISYFGSQPWPFPHNLMVGFTARWAAGEIHVDDTELVDASWYSADALPELLPGKPTIARRLIDWFVETHG